MTVPLIAWKVSECGVISSPYFPVFSSNTGKYRAEITSYLDTFHAASNFQNNLESAKAVIKVSRVSYCLIINNFGLGTIMIYKIIVVSVFTDYRRKIE